MSNFNLDLSFQLLVNSKIISLDLPVKDVYKKIWCPEGEVCIDMWYICVVSFTAEMSDLYLISGTWIRIFSQFLIFLLKF